jgi:NitT/TauT family transport system permease protein
MTATDDLARLEAGLDALETHEVVRSPRWRRVWRESWPPALFVFALVAGWQLLFSFELVPSEDLPSPGQTWGALQAQLASGDLAAATATSVRRAALGFAAAMVLGTGLGVLVGSYRPVRRAIGPLLSVLQSLPAVAWVPATVLWFGATESTVYAVMLFGAVPSIANGVVSGMDQVPPLFHRVGRVLGARGLASVRHIVLPAALPGFLGGVRQGWAFAWRSLMAVELLVSTTALGVGNLLSASNQSGDLAGVFAGVLTILAIGVVVELVLFAPAERRMLRRRGLLADPV